jgi:hypothetical protein
VCVNQIIHYTTYVRRAKYIPIAEGISLPSSINLGIAERNVGRIEIYLYRLEGSERDASFCEHKKRTQEGGEKFKDAK